MNQLTAKHKEEGPAFEAFILANGMITFVDPEDLDRLLPFQWRAFQDKRRKAYYVAAGKSNRLLMHRVILNVPKGDRRQVDHKDGDGLNNRKSNLRIATNAQNQQNTKVRPGSRTGFKGVILRSNNKTNPYKAQIKANGKGHSLGCFPTAEAAARAYDSAARVLFGEFAWLNFPDGEQR